VARITLISERRARQRARAVASGVDPRVVGLVALLLVLAAVSWIVTDARMSGMDMGPGTDPGSLGFYLTTWVVMLAAMMFPSVAPMVIAYSRIHRRRRELGRHAPVGGTAVFVAGYLIAWTAYGLAAYALYAWITSLSPGFLAWDRGGPYAAGAVIMAAAFYQLTGAKDRCLTTCRTPMDFILGRMRHGYHGALRMGVEHGAWCVGCCWALMAALFALGAMSVAWMAVVGAFIAVEKLLPWKLLANRSVAIVLAVLALGVALAPESVPGLTLPDGAAMHSLPDTGGSTSMMR
jgi:predicted metal-binding membrane protein